MNEHCREWTYNRKQLQSISKVLVFVDITVHVFVSLEVETCAVFYSILVMILD